MNHQEEQRHLRTLHMEGTTRWLLDDARFKEWFSEGERTLLFSGAASVGKTVMVSSVIDHLHKTFSAEPFVAMAYVFCRHGQLSTQPTHVLSNLMQQLYTGLDFVPHNIGDLYRQCMEQPHPKDGQTFRALTLLAEQYSRVFIIIDGLDTLDSYDGKIFVGALADIQANANMNILLAQRESLEMSDDLAGVSEIEILASEHELEGYLRRRIAQVPALSGDKVAQHQVMASILQRLNRTPTQEDPSAASKGLAAAFKSIWRNYEAYLTEDEPTGGTPLIWASSKGQIHVVEYLANGSDIESEDLNGRAALSWAAGNGHAAVLQSLLYQGSDVKATDKLQRDALMWAAVHGHLTAAFHLLQNGASFKGRDAAGRTALSLATENGQNALVYLFLGRDASPDIRDSEGRTPLSWAAAGGHLTAMKALLSHHASWSQEDKNGRPPLSWAAGAGQVKAVNLLLGVGANVDLTDQSGRNALSWAAGNGQTEMVSAFLNIGSPALLTGADSSGMTCFSWASRNGHSQTIRLLVDRLDFNTVHQKTRKGETAQFLACQYGHVEVIRIFLERGVFSQHDRNQAGHTALMAAVSAGQFAVAELLLRYNAPINATEFEKMTVLHHAVRSGSLNFVELFLEHGANLEIEDNFGRTPLLTAMEKNFDSIADLLLRSDARVNRQDKDGYSPLHWAVQHNDLKTVQALLRHGANPHVTNNDGLTPATLDTKLNNDPEGKIRQLLKESANERKQTWVTMTF
ncbi:ankyrin repeat-containing domain protein [Penicillium angulare]|uniref:Ankyrin repeat-containing domain protein n=1 Tax=Penicillium angulare TaxID=116970 RepID=A0A9W9FJG6_9EURO|nr:ankyrin repeat-containing domain protein [Penicillium angulare]